MHCPKCGQQQISDETRFCSRCGFALANIAAVVAADGDLPEHLPATAVGKRSQRSNGVRQGLFILLIALFAVPLLAAISVSLHLGPPLSIIALFLLAGSGILRIAYAWLFESPESTADIAKSERAAIRGVASGELPAAPTTAADYIAPAMGGWKADTNDLSIPGSVTDPTTKLLEHERPLDRNDQ